MLYPCEHSPSAGTATSSFSSYYFLKLDTEMSYKVVVEVKGEDLDNNTIIKREKKKIKVD